MRESVWAAHPRYGYPINESLRDLRSWLNADHRPTSYDSSRLTGCPVIGIIDAGLALTISIDVDVNVNHQVSRVLPIRGRLCHYEGIRHLFMELYDMTAKKIGRPSKFRPEFVEQARKLSMLGMTDAEMAKFFEVKEQTLNNWKIDYPEFFESLKEGKVLADGNVVASLYHRALGYSHPEDDIRAIAGEVVITPTIKHYPPDTTACIFWLKNRQPEKWREKPADGVGDSNKDDLLREIASLLPD